MNRLDIPLNNNGQRQVQEATQGLAEYGIDRLMSSPQLRALETLQPLSSLKHLPIEIDTRLSEIRLDRWEGKVFDEIKDDPVYIERRANVLMEPHKEVETIQELMLRMKGFLGDLSKMKGTVICASHMDPLRALHVLIMDWSVETFFQFQIDNAVPSFFEYSDDGWRKVD